MKNNLLSQLLVVSVISVALSQCSSGGSDRTAAEFAKSTFTTSRNNGLTADGTTSSKITFTLLNSNGDPVGGQAVTLAASGEQNTFKQDSPSTNGEGEITATLSSEQNGAKVITATLDEKKDNELLLSNIAVVNFGELFGSPRIFGTDATPYGMALGDFNGDGLMDIATANQGDDNISVLLAVSVGAAGTIFARINTDVGQGPTSLASGDFDNDGKTDLAVANGTDNKVSILIGKGDGTFVQKLDDMDNYVYPTKGVGTAPQAIIAADVNEDENLDLVTANTGSGTNEISVLLGNGKGGFASHTSVNTDAGLVSMVSGDFNGDAHVDLVVVSSSTNRLTYLQGDGAGSFSTKLHFTSGTTPVYVATGDLDGDELLDLVVANDDTTTPLTVHIGKGNGTFQSAITPSVGAISIRGITVADFDANGRPDLAFTETSGNLGVILGDGLGTFGSKETFGTNGSTPRTVLGFDFNGDGIVEPVTANQDSASISIFNVPTDAEALEP